MSNKEGKEEEKTGPDARELFVAYRRLTNALAEKMGWKPKDVERAIGMARADVKKELEVKEIEPLTYRATPVEKLMAEPGEVAAKKGSPYVEKLNDYLDGR